MGLNEDLGDRENIGNASLAMQRAREEKHEQIKKWLWSKNFINTQPMDVADVASLIEDYLKEHIKPKCPDCNSVGMSHCSDPVNCGAVYYPDHLYRELETQITGLTKHLTIQMKRAADAEAELEQWKTWGIIEVAIRNPNVAEYMNHWEGRATKAEAKLENIIRLLS